MQAQTASRATALALGLLLAFTFLKGALWAATIAPLDAPDEPSHFNYVVQVREGYLLPVVDLVSPGGLRTPPSTPLNANVRAWFDHYGFKFFRSMPYESAQPPLYYWMVALWTRPIGIATETLPMLLMAARLLSVLLGVGSVLALWLACRWAWPGWLWLSWATAGALTLHPEFSFTTATVSNDAGVLFWGACMLALWAYGLASARRGPLTSRALGLMAGLAAVLTAAGLLTKLTFASVVPATFLWLWWLSASGSRRPLARWLLASLGFGVASLAMIAPWAARNMRVYGEPTGARAIFDLIHRIYWERMGFPADQLFTNFPPVEFAVRSAQSFWALFGWASVRIEGWAYWTLVAFAGVAAAGLVLGVRRASELRRGLSTPGARLAVLAATTCLLAFANYVGYNSLVEFQPHMRYTFVALVPAVLLIVLGLGSVPVRDRWKQTMVGLFLAALGVAHVMSLLAVAEQSARVLNALGG